MHANSRDTLLLFMPLAREVKELMSASALLVGGLPSLGQVLPIIRQGYAWARKSRSLDFARDDMAYFSEQKFLL